MAKRSSKKINDNPKLFVLLENIRSAYNVGSIFRTCDAAGVECLFLTGFTVYPPDPKLNKTALGSLKSVTWQHHTHPKKLATKLKSRGISLICLETDHNARSLFDIEFKQNTCLVFGNEITGITPDLLQISDQILKIPQFGKKESLNVSVSVGIAVYEFIRKSLKSI